MIFYIYRTTQEGSSCYLNYEIYLEDTLEFSLSSDPKKGIFRSDSHNCLQVWKEEEGGKGEWFYVIIQDDNFILNNDPRNPDPKLMLVPHRKNNTYILAIYVVSSNVPKLNFLKIVNERTELYHTLNEITVLNAAAIDIPDFLWQKKIARMKPLEIEKMTTALTPSSSLFSLSVFLAMALLVL